MSRKPREDRAGAAVVGWLLLGLVVLAGAGYVAAYFAAGDKVPRGTEVAGVAVGGRTHADAAEVLERGLAGSADAPLRVSIDGDTRRVTPSEAGLSVDYAASVDQVGTRRSWDPQWLWDYFTGGDEYDALTAVDPQAQRVFLDAVSDEVSRPVTEGAVTFGSGDFEVTPARTGRTLDPLASRDALVARYLAPDAVAELPIVEVVPEIDEGDVREAVDTFANRAVSSAVTLAFGEARVKVAPADYTPALSLRARDGELVPRLNKKILNGLLVGAVAGDGAPVDATVALVGGRPQVVPARPGVTFEPSSVHRVFLDLVAAPDGEREATVESTVATPAFTTKDARALGIVEQVSTFPTYYPYAEYRNINIGRAAELIDGTVLKPGETFSLNGTVGERTAANGFVEGFVISDGIFKEELGGGVSQIATTTFNAAFFAGLEDVEHKPHSFYIDRYPVGREATVAWPTIDLRFANDTPYGVLIEADVQPATPSSSGVVTVSMWSTKWWDITTTTGEPYNPTSPDTRTLSTEDCYPNEGYGGFDIDIVRYFEPVGANTEQREPETMSTTYTPSDTVVCQPPPGG